MKRISQGVLSIVVATICMVWGSALSHAGYVHPGLLNNRAEYDLMRTKVAAKAEPWYSQYKQIPDYRSHTPQPIANFYTDFSNQQHEAVLLKDATAAYASALHWVITGNAQHASKAKEIVNAWAYTLKTIKGNSQQRLAISWKWYGFMLTAEILKHLNGQWSTADQAQFAKVLRTLIIPNLQWTDVDGSGGNTPRNNWAAFGAMERLAVGLYLDDQALVTLAISDAKTLINFYIGTFGNPVPPGFTFETCRLGNGSMGTLEGGDLHHTFYGLGALANTAEMAKKQGVNLYGHKDPGDKASLLTALLYHAPFVGYPSRGSDATWPCKIPLEDITTNGTPAPWPMVANHYQDPTLKAIAKYMGLKTVGVGVSYSGLTHNYNLAPQPTPTSPLISAPTNVHIVSK